MSLLTDSMEECVILNKVYEDDDYGGYYEDYKEGVHFKCAITFDTSIEARVAGKQGVTSLYTVITEKNGLELQYNDLFKRLSDGKVFRVTSDGTDNKTPDSADLSMRQVTAEEYNLQEKTGRNYF